MPRSKPADIAVPGPFTIEALRRCAAEHECRDCAYVLTRLVTSGEITPVDLAAQLAINEGPEEAGECAI
jgi:hypothetical protein